MNFKGIQHFKKDTIIYISEAVFVLLYMFIKGAGHLYKSKYDIS